MAFLPSLICFPPCPLVAKGHHAFGGPGQDGDDEAGPRNQILCMPFNLGDHPALLAPRGDLITEAVVESAHLVGWATDGTREQVSDACLKNRVGLETDGVLVGIGFHELTEILRGEGRIASEVAPLLPIRITPIQERTTAYRDSSAPDSRSDARCASIIGDLEEPTGAPG